MQLDATLRSFLLNCADGDQTRLTVLYWATTSLHAGQYAELIQEYSSFSHINFQRQARFRQDVLGLLAAHADLRSIPGLYRRMAGLHRRLSFLSQPLLRFGEPRYILFLVDDNLFVRNFRLADVLYTLEQQPQALGFSLRLGGNTTYCYSRNLPQSLPEFTPVEEGALRFDWTRGDLDFAYPLEVSSSIYRIADLLPLLNRQRFANPNQLESRMEENADRFHHRRFLVCYSQSVAFSNPVNQVAERHQNRYGNLHPLTSKELAENFATGLRIDIHSFVGFVPQGCHQEVELRFYPSKRGVHGV
jgi:hypothetical protein